MPRIAGVDIPREKKTEIALTYIYGIGRTLSGRILAETRVDGNKRAKDLTDQEVASLAQAIQKNCVVEGDRRREVQQNIKRLMDIRCYRGIRHIKGLPVRGQRSHTNARTRKGPKKTVGGANKKPPSPK
jgi:small subunit ribosomal protein S13